MNKVFGDRFLGRGGPVWSEIGVSNPAAATASKAVKKAKLDYNIILAPVSGQVDTPMGTQLVNIEKKSAILREPTSDDPEYRFFGFASPEYGIVQNMDIAKSLDTLTDDWPVETVGALGYGETIFITLDAGERKIKGEDLKLYFLVTDTRDGGTSMKIAFTPVRVACYNTLVTGLKSSLVTVSMDHVASIGSVFDSRVSLVKRLTAAQDSTLEIFDMMSKFKLKGKQFERVIEAAYPLPKRPKKAVVLDEVTVDESELVGMLYDEASHANQLWEYYCQRALGLRDAASELFAKFNDEFPKTANTGWAVYNAVVETADFRNGSDSVPVSAIWGARAQEKKRAFTEVSSLMKTK